MIIKVLKIYIFSFLFNKMFCTFFLSEWTKHVFKPLLIQVSLKWIEANFKIYWNSFRIVDNIKKNRFRRRRVCTVFKMCSYPTDSVWRGGCSQFYSVRTQSLLGCHSVWALALHMCFKGCPSKKIDPKKALVPKKVCPRFTRR